MRESPQMATFYLDPLSAAYRRMKTALFRPFNLDKWIAVGFASWISGWSAGGGFNSLSRFPTNRSSNAGAALKEGFGSFLQGLSEDWADPWWRVGLIVVVVLILALSILFGWIFARGEFVFLDAVLHGRRAIAQPWRERRTEGNSLFVWRLTFGLLSLSAFALVATIIFFLASGGRIPKSVGEVHWLWLFGGLGLVWVPVVIAMLYVELFLRNFVTPIMFRDRATATEAWRTFAPILRERLGSFLLFGLFVVAVQIGLMIALIPAILLTCCTLGCLLVLPFIGAVVWLPVSYTFRAYGPEFLAQFGPAYDVWPQPAASPAAPEDLPA
jgi:hypothetical protein